MNYGELVALEKDGTMKIVRNEDLVAKWQSMGISSNVAESALGRGEPAGH